MDTEIPQENTVNLPPKLNPRVRTPLRLRYLAEVEVFKKKAGSLEEIREKLNLSQRKICQILLVDPSAWTRWTRSSEDAPPHIYRSLQWFLSLQDLYPEMKNTFWLAGVISANSPVDASKPALVRAENLAKASEVRSNLMAKRLSELELEVQNHRKMTRAFIAATVFCLCFGLSLGAAVVLLLK